MARRALLLGLGSILAVVVTSGVLAAAVTVKSGVFEKVSPDGKTITVKFGHAEESTELSVAANINVRYDGKPTELTAIKPGMSVTVQIDGKEAQLIIARAARDEEPRVAKPSKPKTTSKSTSKTALARKSKANARKSSKASSSRRDPGPLDEMPWATTPLASMGSAPGGRANGPSPLDSMPTATTPLAGSRTSNGNRNGPSPLDSMPAATTPLASGR